MPKLNMHVYGQEPYTPVTPQNLTRFYQVYLASQDTRYKHPVIRLLSVPIQVVQISTVFLIACIIFTLLSVLGMAKYVLFWIRNRSHMGRTPQSKIDWMILSVEGATSRTVTPRLSPDDSHNQKHRYSVTSTPSRELGLPKTGKRKSDFETATYGFSSITSNTLSLYATSLLSRQSSQGSYLPLEQTPPQPDIDDVSLTGGPPRSPAGPLDDNSRPR